MTGEAIDPPGCEEILAPRPLKQGDLIRIISPSLPSMAFATKTREFASNALAEMGFRCDFSRHSSEISDDGRSAGSAQMRTDDLHEALLDPDVSAVMCAVGGGTSHELLPLLDRSIIRANPKALIGRSDNTYLNAFFLTEAKLSSFNGVAFISQFGEPEQVPETVKSTAEVLLSLGDVSYRSSSSRTVGVRPWQQYASHDKRPLVRPRTAFDAWLRSGSAQGRLVGGEISIVVDLIKLGLLDASERVLWLDIGIEDADYFGRQSEDLLAALNGKLPCALLIADNPWMPFEVWTEKVNEFLDLLQLGAERPVFVGGNIGHYQPAWLLPYGAMMSVDSNSGITFLRECSANSTDIKEN